VVILLDGQPAVKVVSGNALLVQEEFSHHIVRRFIAAPFLDSRDGLSDADSRTPSM